MASMQKDYAPFWMQRQGDPKYVTHDHLSSKLRKVFSERRYLYSPPSNISELETFTSSQSEATPAPGPDGVSRCEPVCRRPDPFQSMKAQRCGMTCDGGENSTGFTDCDWTLRILLHLTFSSNLHDPSPSRETTGRRYLYAPPSERSGFVDESYTSTIRATSA